MHDVALTWTAPAVGLYQFSTAGSVDTVLYVLDDCSGAELACNDDSGGSTSAVEVALGSGDTVVLVVGSFAGLDTSGDLLLTVSN